MKWFPSISLQIEKIPLQFEEYDKTFQKKLMVMMRLGICIEREPWELRRRILHWTLEESVIHLSTIKAIAMSQFLEYFQEKTQEKNLERP
jgi:hypothetical protein